MDDGMGIQSLQNLSDYYMEIVETSVNTEDEHRILNQAFEKHNVQSVLDVACGVGYSIFRFH